MIFKNHGTLSFVPGTIYDARSRENPGHLSQRQFMTLDYRQSYLSQGQKHFCQGQSMKLVSGTIHDTPGTIYDLSKVQSYNPTFLLGTIHVAAEQYPPQKKD